MRTSRVCVLVGQFPSANQIIRTRAFGEPTANLVFDTERTIATMRLAPWFLEPLTGSGARGLARGELPLLEKQFLLAVDPACDTVARREPRNVRAGEQNARRHFDRARRDLVSVGHENEQREVQKARTDDDASPPDVGQLAPIGPDRRVSEVLIQTTVFINPPPGLGIPRPRGDFSPVTDQDQSRQEDR